MNVLVTGGTGLIGSALCQRLLKDNHNIWVLTRSPTKIVDTNIKAVTSLNHLDPGVAFDVIINLAGAGIADKRWSLARKHEIYQSRLQITEQLVDYLQNQASPHCTLINASAIGIYGASNAQDIKSESSLGDDSFSSQLCEDWEAAASKARQLGNRVCIFRFGIVLAPNGGALDKMLLPFKLGLGGPVGNGSQWMSWVHIHDVINAISHAIDNDNMDGSFNLTAPNPATNKQFSKTLAKVLHRPAIFPMPAFIVKLLFGQMGQELLLSGAKVDNSKLVSSGFLFKFTNLQEALDNCVNAG